MSKPIDPKVIEHLIQTYGSRGWDRYQYETDLTPERFEYLHSQTPYRRQGKSWLEQQITQYGQVTEREDMRGLSQLVSVNEMYEHMARKTDQPAPAANKAKPMNREPLKINLGARPAASNARGVSHAHTISVVAGERLYAAQHVVVREGKGYSVERGLGIGVVDPFLIEGVDPGASFWLMVYPGVAKGEGDDWTHHGLPDAGQVEDQVEDKVETQEIEVKGFASQVWMANFIAGANEAIKVRNKAEGLGLVAKITFEEVIKAATTWCGGRPHGLQEPGQMIYRESSFMKLIKTGQEFWDHFAAITGLRPSMSYNLYYPAIFAKWSDV